jgi:DNA-binding MarR family transcriptional regulator
MPHEIADPTLTPAARDVLGERLSSPGLLLAMVGHAAMRRLRDTHTAHHLTPRQFRLLALLGDQGATGQSELAAALGADPSILVTMLNPLEDDGLISRERDPSDRRRHVVTLTAAGEAHLVRTAQAQREAEDELFDVLDNEQREQLRGLLMLLQDSLTSAQEPSCSLDHDLGAGISPAATKGVPR